MIPRNAPRYCGLRGCGSAWPNRLKRRGAHTSSQSLNLLTSHLRHLAPLTPLARAEKTPGRDRDGEVDLGPGGEPVLALSSAVKPDSAPVPECWLDPRCAGGAYIPRGRSRGPIFLVGAFQRISA